MNVLKGQIKRNEDIGEVEIIDWKDDHGEKAHRIFEWWKLRIHDVKCFTHYKLALRLVVLTQTSSAYVERVFSQWQNIVDICGSQQKKEMAVFLVDANSEGQCIRLLVIINV